MKLATVIDRRYSQEMSRFANALIVIAIWAGIYLPGLGSMEIKGEEGRRILPAITMLESGNYLMPQVGSEPYFRKPPLVNWLVAASFRIFGERDEWTARLPSALCVLAVAFAFVTIARRSLGAIGSLIAALIWMTNFGMIEKGRLIELEALYVSLTGLAFICWLSFWKERRSPWLTWIVPWIFLGLGLLAKGPLHLFFFYAIVVAVLMHERPEGGGPTPQPAWRPLAHRAHFAGMAIMLAIFAAWAIPFLQLTDDVRVAQTWSQQFTGRFTGQDFHLAGWLMNIPRGLGYFLPWTLLLPWAFVPQFDSERERNLARGLGLGAALSFLIVCLIPGALARYTMPLLVPISWLMAMTLSVETVSWPRPFAEKPLSAQQVLRKVIGLALIVCAAMCLYAIAIIPRLQHRQKVKTIAAQINAAVPASEPLYAVNPDYQPFLFYVRDPIIYLSRVTEAPFHARYLLVPAEKATQVTGTTHWQPLIVHPILRLKDYRNKEVVLLRVGDAK